MVVGIVGLGLIGGSFAKAYKKENHTVYGLDKDDTTMKTATLTGTVDGVLTDNLIKDCDCVIIALSFGATVEYLKENACKFQKGQLVMDTCGIKEKVCELGFELAKDYGFAFVGAHPMAGTQFSGFANSKEDMFFGATMAFVPPDLNDNALIERATNAVMPLKFANFTLWTPRHHDKIIAFTSQLAHIVSNAYMKSPSVKERNGLSAGSYKDLTRVAYLNTGMWAELFMNNKDNILFELDTIIASLGKYRDAIAADDEPELENLLLEGKILKQEEDNF